MRPTWDALTIVTSCRGYGKYLKEWSESIIKLTVYPGAVCIYTHGLPDNRVFAEAAVQALQKAGIKVSYTHSPTMVDLGRARNLAVAMSTSEWVMHLDADDTLMPHALEEYMKLAADADVISSGYVRSGSNVTASSRRKERLYKDADGEKALDLPALCSGISPFRRTFWEKSPYRLDMLGAWDTALWIGFARLGARFRATKRAVFHYRQHLDSVFNQRRHRLGWARVRTQAQLKHLRRNGQGVAVIVPRDKGPSVERRRVWERVKKHYETHHPEWKIVEAICPGPVWSKGAAIRAGIESTKMDVIVVADADCIVDPQALEKCVQDVLRGHAWAMPHKNVHRANAAYTEQVLASDGLPVFPAKHQLARNVYEGAPGGGIFVMRTVWYDAIGGIPIAFREWGSEDKALACLANTLLGECSRGTADLLHLWHGEQNTNSSIAQQNVLLLRKMGHAATLSKDHLVSVAFTMPSPTLKTPSQKRPFEWKRNHGTAKPINPIPVERVRERQEALRRKRP